MAETPPERRDFRQEVTDKLVAMLERGTAPWQQPWDPSKAPLAMPLNPTTGKAYRGGNALHLLAVGTAKGYEDPRWLTYKQAQENGWQVRKGEKSTYIEFWQFPSRSGDGKETPGGEKDNGEGDKRAPLHRVYSVFNASQIEGVPPWERKIQPEWQVVRSAENIIAGLGIPIHHDQQDKAFYRRSTDRIHLPPPSAFPSPAHYYGTALHELGHATGHESRLNRPTLTQSDGFGGPEYAKEELRAELTSLFLAAERGIPHDPEQHAAYVNGWIDVLRRDKNEIFRAAKDASAATEYLLDRELKNELERAETSEHVATFDSRNGAVEIVEKNTATASRELIEPAHSSTDAASADAHAAGKMANEQILDGVVDGRPAPNGPAPESLPRTPATHAASWAAARQLAEDKLGPGAQTLAALTDSGRYEGPIIGATNEHVVQQFTPRAAVIHDAESLPGIAVDPAAPVVIDYNRGLASVQAVEPRQWTRELAELER